MAKPLTQETIVILLKRHIDHLDHAMTNKLASRAIMRLMAEQPGRIATNHVLHNIGKRRTARLMEFLSKH